MSRLRPRAIEVGGERISYGEDGWSVGRLDLLELVRQFPDATDEMASLRVGFDTKAGKKAFVTSKQGWRVDHYTPPEKRIAPQYSAPYEPDPRFDELDLAEVFAEIGTSTVMTQMPWLQSVIDLERVTGGTHQDFWFVAGINELQGVSPDNYYSQKAERTAAFLDASTCNPQGEFGPPYRLTRNIQLLRGVHSPIGQFNLQWYGPNIQHGRGFGLGEIQDEWVVWSLGGATAGRGEFALFPVNQIASVTERLPGGNDGLIIPTNIGRQALATM